MKAMKKIFVVLGSVLLLFACNQKSASGRNEDKVVMAEMSILSNDDYGGEFVSDEKNKTSGSYSTEQKIIKNGNLRFQTSDLDKTAAQICESVKKHKAQIQSDSQGKGYNLSYRNISIRYTSQDLDRMLDEISQGVYYLDTKEISSEDVTEQYKDIEARLKAKKELENRYLENLQNAQKVSEILEIE